MAPLFLDIGPTEFVLLLVIAIVLFGPEKLPDFARKAARVVRYLRTVAGSAQDQLSKELGPGFEDLDFRDLNPRTFVQKHLLDDVDPIVADVKQDLTDVAATGRSSSAEITEAIQSVKPVSAGGPGPVGVNGANGVGGVNGAASHGAGVNGAAGVVAGASLSAAPAAATTLPEPVVVLDRELTPYDPDST